MDVSWRTSKRDGEDGERRSENSWPAMGAILHVGLTVDDAPEVRECYAPVVGWQVEPLPMEGYGDIWKSPTNGDQLGGI